MEVEVREDATPSVQTQTSGYNGTTFVADGPIIVRVEEILLVVLVLVIWVGAIALFFNRWGKIRMLEPYQPKFHQQQHRPSCPLAPLSPPGILNHQVGTISTRSNQYSVRRMSFSKYNVNAMTDPLSALPSPIIKRPRLNSVFVGGSTMTVLNPPRRVKSATDLHHLVVNEKSPTASLTGSVIPIFNTRDHRPSLITIERPPTDRPIYISRRRPSIAVDRTFYQAPCARARRSSCFAAQSSTRHKNFISFEHPDRRTPSTMIIGEQRSCSYQQPTISFETPKYQTSEISPSQRRSSTHRGISEITQQISRSFEQPTSSKPKPERMAASLEVSTSFSIERKLSIPTEEDLIRSNRSSTSKISIPEEAEIHDFSINEEPENSISIPVNRTEFKEQLNQLSSKDVIRTDEPSVVIQMEEVSVTESFLENMKSSDV